MSIVINITTTANRTRRFTQTDSASVQEILDSFKHSGQLFSNRTLIISSADATEIFAPAAITRIEIETQLDLTPYLPQHVETRLSLIPEGSTLPPTEVSDTHFSGRADFFFQGGDTVPIWISGPRPSGAYERLSNLTRLFEKPVLLYSLPAGGVGFMNPHVMTRAVVAAGMDVLPAGAWRLNAAD
jgi:hypothetical protein